jgi:Ran GTPase-activating protein (RanGAP) involved in mRNA processing and transport
VTFVDVKAPDAASEINVIVSTLFVSAPNIATVRFEKTKVSPSSISAAMYSTSLKDLALVNNGFTDEDLNDMATAIAKCQSIEKLDFTGNDTTDVGCMAASSVLKKNTSLQVALFDGDMGFTERSVEANPIAADGSVPRAA